MICCLLFDCAAQAPTIQDLLRNAVHSTLEDDSFSIDAPLAKTSKQCASRLLGWLKRTDNKSQLELLVTFIFQELEKAF